MYPSLPNPRWVALRLLDGDEQIQQALLTGELGQLSASSPNRQVDTQEKVQTGLPESSLETFLTQTEEMRWDLIEQAAEVVMGPLREQDVPMIVFDLSDVTYFGSVFLALLLRCHKFVRSRGGELVLAGASKMALELLRVTALDTLWAIYETKEEALDAISS